MAAGDPGCGFGVSAGPSPHPDRGGPALQPPPPRRRPDDSGVQRPAAPAGRLGGLTAELLAVVDQAMQPTSDPIPLVQQVSTNPLTRADRGREVRCGHHTTIGTHGRKEHRNVVLMDQDAAARRAAADVLDGGIRAAHSSGVPSSEDLPSTRRTGSLQGAGFERTEATGSGAGDHLSISQGIRLAELLAAISLATDLGRGFPQEKALRTCLVAERIAEALCLDRHARSDAYYAALIHPVGCTAFTYEGARLFGSASSWACRGCRRRGRRGRGGLRIRGRRAWPLVRRAVCVRRSSADLEHPQAGALRRVAAPEPRSARLASRRRRAAGRAARRGEPRGCPRDICPRGRRSPCPPSCWWAATAPTR